MSVEIVPEGHGFCTLCKSTIPLDRLIQHMRVVHQIEGPAANWAREGLVHLEDRDRRRWYGP